MNSCRECKHYKKDERIGIIVCEFGIQESYCEKDKEDFAIEELEKIKDEILNLGFTGWADKPKLDREEVLTILDKYISELSGENKQIRCNSCQNNTDELSGECYECVKGIKDWYEPIFDKNKSVKINGIETDFIIVHKDFIKEELEKIKAEIGEEKEYYRDTQDWGRYYGLSIALETIDKHIKENK